MKKNIIIFLFLFIFLISLNSLAKNITPEYAKQVATSWLSSFNSNEKISNVSTLKYLDKKIGYVFHLYPQGFILIPANDNLPPIKAYSFKNNFDEDSFFANFLKREIYNLLYNNFDKIDYAANEKLWNDLLENNNFAEIIQKGPLLKTTWNQAPFYNEKYPTVCSGSDDNVTIAHYYAGCVIIATGQIMKYYKWPIKGRGAHSYEEASTGIRSAIFSDRNYNWDIMPDSLPASLDNFTDNESIDELSLLLSDLSIALEAKLTEDGTSAYLFTASDILYKYFKYKPSHYIFRRNYGSDAQWFEVFKNEIDNGRPALLGLSPCSNASVGHAVVVDGYKIDGDLKLLHINMGFGGDYDGWYAVNNILSYLDQIQQDAVIGIEPDKKTDYLMVYDNLKPGDTIANIVKLDEEGKDETDIVYEVVKFTPKKCGYLEHIAYFIPFPHVAYEISLFEGGDNLTASLKSTPLYNTSGQTDFTGWNFVEANDNIKIIANKTYYVLISLKNILEDFDYIIPDSFKYLIATDNDGNGTGNSYYGTSIDNLEEKKGEDVLIRVGLRDSYSCDNSSTSQSTTTPENNLTESGFNLYKYDGKNILMNPDNITSSVMANDNVTIQPEANVPDKLIGEKVNLKLFLYLPQYNLWIPFSEIPVTLSDKVTFTNISTKLDFTGLSGMNLQVWFGFVLNNGDVYYNNYNIVVK